ncbi:Egh16-like virulence factor [Microdochium nivale]|nr:Egh16-like virulence factor [Microdochium nivale]
MVSSRVLYGLSTVVALVSGQAIIQKAVGDSGQSKSLLVNQNDAKDANVIRQQEIVANIVNECGRTLLAGNIDIGEQTEIALAAGEVTQSTKAGKVTVTINQGSNAGSGPFTCDMDLTGNSNGAVGQTPLKVTQSRADFGTGVMTLEVEMPQDMACIGASTGDVCTVRCRNAQEFGGCFAVQQTDTKANANAPNNIETAATLDQVLKQTAQAQKDFEASVGAIAGSGLTDQGTAVADALIANNEDILDDGNAGNGGGGGGGGNNGGGNGGAGRGNGNGGGNGRGGNNNNGGGNGRGNGRGGNNNRKRYARAVRAFRA